MSELKWNWVYYPYLDAPNKQEESALKAGYIKVVIKDEADKVIAEKDKEIALLKERICNGYVSRLTWIDDCLAKDKEIEELKKKLMPCLNGDCILTCEVVEKYGKENAELKQKLESVQASMYCDVVDANMEVRRLKRALYKVCDNWAVCEMDYWRKCLEHYEDYFNVRTDEDLTEEKCERMIDNWRKVAHNCRAKAEEYK